MLEWLKNLFGGASEHVDNVQQHLQDTNVGDIQQQASDAAQHVGDQASQVQDQAANAAQDVKDRFTNNQQ